MHTQVLHIVLGELELGLLWLCFCLALLLASACCILHGYLNQRIMKIICRQSFCQAKRSTLLTGIQPTGDLHIGNFLGSVTNMLKLQQDPSYHRKYLMIADFHSLTTALAYQHSTISFNQQIGADTLSMAKVLLASGIDPAKMCLFVQSQVPAHCELTWILSCLGPQHWLNTMIQYKQKAHENSSIGLYTYPILMAVDILLYKSTHVPVGVDQLQHIELTNKYAARFNKQFRTTFFPKVRYVQSKFPKVMSLVNPQKKMSKSDPNQRSRITLTDSQETIHEKIRRAVTDSDGNNISYDPAHRPGLSNLIQIYSAFTSKEIQDVCQQLRQRQTNIGQFKELLSDAIWSRLNEIQEGMSRLSDGQVRSILQKGASEARSVSEQHLKEIKQILSLYT